MAIKHRIMFSIDWLSTKLFDSAVGQSAPQIEAESSPELSGINNLLDETSKQIKNGECIKMSDTTDTIVDAATSAAEAAATTATTTVLSELTATDTSGESLIEKAQAEITRLTKEIGTTKDWFVKIRNSAEVIVLTGLIAGAAAGTVAAIKELKDKVS